VAGEWHRGVTGGWHPVNARSGHGARVQASREGSIPGASIGHEVGPAIAWSGASIWLIPDGDGALVASFDATKMPHICPKADRRFVS